MWKAMSKATWKAWIGVLALLLGFAVQLPVQRPAAAAPAEVAPAAGEGNTSASGAFTTSVEIDVPEFHGLEPELDLFYDSGNGNGFTGMGWALGGQSFVERSSPGGGVPAYNAADVFLVDGQELVPGCAVLGGTHCPRRQSFQRIRRDTVNDRWEMWDTDGTKSTYTPVYTVGQGTFRWALTEQRDTHGNTVTYTYLRQAPENAYLDTISYNGTAIKLWREPRPDPISFTNGESVAFTSFRLKTIEVLTGGMRAGAYKLTYGQAPSTGRSRLAGVQRFGRDAVLDGSGTVTGGTALPPVTLSYQDGTARFGAQSFNGSIGGWDPATIKDLFADVDGDGKTDLVRIYRNGTSAFAQVNKSNGSGYPTVSFNGSIGGWNDTTRDFLADVTGDGRADLVRIWNNGSGYAQVNPSNGSGFPTQSFNGSVGGWNPCCIKEHLVDVNGDYRADLVRIWKNGTSAHAQVSLSNGSGFPSIASNNAIGGWNDSTLDYLADVSGDGQADLVRIWDNGSAFAQVNLSDGTAFPVQTFNGNVGGWNPGHVYNHLADLNGDGKADLIRIWDNGGAYAQVSLSSGRGYPSANWNGAVGGWNPAVISDQFADVNGDGRTDLVRVYKNGLDRYAEIRPYDGKGFPAASFNGRLGGWGDGTWRSYVADVSGDAKADVVTIWNSPGTGGNAQVNKADGLLPDLLTRAGNGIGGTATVAYSPSSRWWSAGHNLPDVFPTVASIAQDDGRGTSFTTNYTFADGLWAWQPAERRFLGFGYSKAILDAEGTYEETFYRQSLAGAGQPDREYLKDAAGRIYHYDQWQYTETSTAPYVSQISSKSHFECNLTTPCRQSRVDYSYDTFGNETLETDHGDVMRGGDELTTATTFAPNTTDYLVDLPASETSHAGASTAAAQVAKTLYFYNAAGDETREDKWNSDTGGYVTTTAAYDPFGNVVSTTDERGSTDTTVYDGTFHAFPVRECDALNHCLTRNWDTVLGVESDSTDANNAVTRHAYDPLGRLTQTTDPAGNTTTWQFFDIGDPGRQRVRETLPDGSPDGLWTEEFYDGLGRTYQSVKEGPTAGVTYTQDSVYRSTTDLVWKQSLWRPSGQAPRYTVSAHDGAGRMVRTTHPDGSFIVATHGIDAEGLPFTTTLDELSHETTTWSDVDGELAKVREKNAGSYYTTSYLRDAQGKLIRWTDAAGNSSTVVYNSLGWKRSMNDMDMGAWSYQYDNGGLLIGQTDAKQQATTFGYDALERPTVRTEPGNQISRWFYDEAGHGTAIGRLTRVTYPSGSDSYDWNSRGLETSSTRCVDTVCKVIGSSYDTLGRVSSTTYPDGENVAYGYDAAGRMTRVGGYVTAMSWSPGGQLLSMTYGNGTVASYTYNADREWLDSAVVTASGQTRYQATYGYNAAGLVTSMAQGTPVSTSVTYGYDDLNRLTSVSGAQNQTFSYDAIGNVTSNSAVGGYSYGDPAHKHAVTAAGSASYVYDGNGNMTSGDGRTLAWDGADRLRTVTQNGISTTFTYDSDGVRLKKVNGATTIRYFDKLAEEVNGALVKYYYAGPMVVARKQGGTTHWYHSDRLGSIRLMTDAAGAEVRDYDYKPFGSLQASSGTVANERTFTGHIQDDSTGLLYMLARYHDPKLGRFISPDGVIPELDEPQDINRYSYVRNNPVNNIDPTGNAPAGCDAACMRAWSRAQNRAAQKKASRHKARPSRPHNVNREQERWEKRARTRLGRAIHRRAHHAATKKRNSCDEIWCYRTKDGRPKVKPKPRRKAVDMSKALGKLAKGLDAANLVTQTAKEIAEDLRGRRKHKGFWGGLAWRLKKAVKVDRRFLNSAWVAPLKRVAGAVGLLDTWQSTRGRAGWKRVASTALVVGGGFAGGQLGAAAGGACVYGAPVCSAVLGAAGGYAGAKMGENLANRFLD